MKVLRSTPPTRKNNGQLAIFRDDNETCVSNGLPPPPRDSPLSWPPDDVDADDVVVVCVDRDALDELDSVCVVVCRVVAGDVGSLDVIENVDGDIVRLFVAVAVAVDCVGETEFVVEAEVCMATEELGEGRDIVTLTRMLDQEPSLCKAEDRVPRRVHIIAHIFDDMLDYPDPHLAYFGAA
ncbi:hypothetical protein VPNG_00872 [Cytospora leucostoma]|uniref:Uncharacterized protein n=1 Tax=Cytospora leucostoma TaxID=1230097 RepID=A0A423XM33_9PEZI|nr:hypothetical protein VPNG_00872 [Cytospora leucostoma]